MNVKKVAVYRYERVDKGDLAAPGSLQIDRRVQTETGYRPASRNLAVERAAVGWYRRGHISLASVLLLLSLLSIFILVIISPIYLMVVHGDISIAASIAVCSILTSVTALLTGKRDDMRS